MLSEKKEENLFREGGKGDNGVWVKKKRRKDLVKREQERV